ncbi:MAG: murein biosynthesis integral membrane protein MurJ [Thermoanaerobaculia bacterium]
MTAAPLPAEEARGRLVRSAFLITLMTLLSRVTGYVRNMVIAAIFGAGVSSDVFWAAFRIPNIFRQLVAEGALPGVFIPSYADRRRREGEEAAPVFVGRILSALTFLVSGITVLGIVFAPAIVRLLARGFAQTPGKLELTVYLTRLMFPYLCFISVAALLQAILNAHGRFAVSALSPILLNLAIVGAAALLAPRMEEPTAALAVGVLVGGLLQMLIQLPAVLSLRAVARPKLDFSDPAVRGVFLLLIPRLFGFGIYAINIALSTRFASVYGDGAVSYLTYANQVVELVRGGFVISVATAILPLLSQQALEEDRRPLKGTLRFGLRMVAFVTVPWAVGLIVLREPIIRVLFERGRFGPLDTAVTAHVLSLYAIGLVFVSSNNLLVGAHYARKDTRAPVFCAAADLAVFVTAALLLRASGFGVGSVALATSCGAAVNCLMLVTFLRRQEGLLGGREIARSALRILVAAAAMGAIVWWLGFRAFPEDPGAGLAAGLLRVGLITLAGAAVYLGTAFLVRSSEPSEFVRLLRRRVPATPTSLP